MMCKTLLLLALVAAPAAAETPETLIDSATLRAEVEQIRKEMKPGQGFAWRPVLKDGAHVAALEYWLAPGRPAVHPTEAEYGFVVEGAGTLLAGGALVEPEITNPTLTEGSRIEGGTSRPLKAGDVFLIPAGTPHWFDVDGRLVILGMKLPK